MDDVLGQIATTYQAHYIDHDMDVSAVTDFDNVKDKIVRKLINEEAAILNDDIRQEIADKVGDFYVLPSSVHETLIIPKDAGMELRDLEQMVQEVNQTQVAPQERLSDHVYEYDAKEHELFRSDRAEERTKQKEEKRDEKK